MSSLSFVDQLRIKTIMYAMITAIESDFIDNFSKKLSINDLPQEVIDHANKVETESNPLLKILKGLDLQAYITICNRNITTLSISQAQKDFLNKNLAQIIPIRNAVMHPRPLGFFDSAMLERVFNSIDTELNFFDWNNVAKTRTVIRDDPDSLAPPPRSRNTVIENLPLIVDYEETSFIGRKREIGEIKNKLKKKNVNVLSIIGAGGIGKTALALKVLYDLLEDDDCGFDLIIWVSLKTTELTDSDFSEVKDSITSISEMFESLKEFTGVTDEQSPQEYLITLAQNFRTLFVLDNLETINTDDIREFVDEFTEHGKILITSRIGLGEMEHRYPLRGLSEADIEEYGNILLNLYGFECQFSDERKKQIFIDELYSNPLAIKWFIRCLHNHQDENAILEHKDDLVVFCMENVYEKLSVAARTILDMLTIAGVEMTVPEVMYYTEWDLGDVATIKRAINELGKSNFISEEHFQLGRIVVTEIAKDYLSTRYTALAAMRQKYKELVQKISSFGQKVLTLRKANPFDKGSYQYSNKGEQVISYFISQAIPNRYFWEENQTQDDSAPRLKIQQLQTILPCFFECNLALAFVYGVSAPQAAEQEFSNAFKYASTSDNQLRVSMLRALFLIRNNDYLSAIELLNELQRTYPECEDIKLEKSKALGCVGQFDDAFSELDQIHAVDLRISNRIVAQKVDLFCRKANALDSRKTREKLAIARQGVECLEQCENQERIILDYWAEIILVLLGLYQDEEALQYTYNTIKKHIKLIRKSRKYRKIQERVEEIHEKTDSEWLKSIQGLIVDLRKYLSLLKNDEYLVTAVKDGFGFCQNAERSGVYFSMTGLPEDIAEGDILSSQSVFESRNGPQIIRPQKVGNMIARIGC